MNTSGAVMEATSIFQDKKKLVAKVVMSIFYIDDRLLFIFNGTIG
jgi:hypothetical protein